MNFGEVQMTEAESLQLIASMINKAQNGFTESGKLYLLWGWLICCCCIIQFEGLHLFHYDKIYFVLYSTWLLLIYQFFYMGKLRKRRRVKMYTGEIVMYVWITYIIIYALLIFILVYNNAVTSINPVILTTFGIPTFLIGIILKFNPLKIGGICCWLLAIAAVFITYDFQFLLIALAVIVAWIIPGYGFQQLSNTEH